MSGLPAQEPDPHALAGEVENLKTELETLKGEVASLKVELSAQKAKHDSLAMLAEQMSVSIGLLARDARQGNG